VPPGQAGLETLEKLRDTPAGLVRIACDSHAAKTFAAAC
jgi:hypothetical protein